MKAVVRCTIKMMRKPYSIRVLLLLSVLWRFGILAWITTSILTALQEKLETPSGEDPQWIVSLDMTNWTDYRLWVVGVVSLVISMILLWKLPRILVWIWKKCISKPIQTATLAMRGITVEAAIEGSHLVEGNWPDWQVQILRNGLLTSTHVGFGVRLNNTLIMPLHVSKIAGDQFLVKSKKSTVLLSGCGRKSDVVSDLCYFEIPNKIWSQIGATSARRVKFDTKTKIAVSCCGVEGFSTGPLVQSPIVGIMYYSGTTYPGMSGAGYYINDTCYGIHLGAAAGPNIGATMLVPYAEVVEEIHPENAPQEDDEEYIWDPITKRFVRKHKKNNTWGAEEVHRAANKRTGLAPAGHHNQREFGEAMTPDTDPISQLSKEEFDRVYRSVIQEHAKRQAHQLTGTPVQIVYQAQSPGNGSVVLTDARPVGPTMYELINEMQDNIHQLETTNDKHSKTIKMLEDSIKKFGTVSELNQIKKSAENALRRVADLERKVHIDTTKVSENVKRVQDALDGQEKNLGDAIRNVAADACYLTANRYGAHQCDVCRKQFDSELAVIEHRETAHGWKNYQKLRDDGSCVLAKPLFEPKTVIGVGKQTNPLTEDNELLDQMQADQPSSIKEDARPLTQDEQLQRQLPHGCRHCKRRFANHIALATHVAAKHDMEVVGEAADSADLKMRVKTDSFLDGTPHLRHKRKIGLNKPSKSSTTAIQLSRLEETQSEMKAYLRDIALSLKSSRNPMDGQSLGTMQN